MQLQLCFPCQKRWQHVQGEVAEAGSLMRNRSDAEAQGVRTQTQSVKVSTSKRCTFCPHLWGWFPLHMSNRPTVPFTPPSYAAIKLSSQNILFLTVKKLPPWQPLLRRYSAHCKTRISLHRQIIYPTTQITSTPGISWECKYPACKTSNLKMGWRRGEKSLQNLWVWNGWIILTWLLGFLSLKQHPSRRKGFCDTASWLCVLLEHAHSVQHFIMMTNPPWRLKGL